jgi:hypothetical protein
MYLRAVRGMHALVAAAKLQFVISPYAQALKKLILSAASNANSERSNCLIIKEATVGRGRFLKRIKFHGKGRVGHVTKFSSNVRVVLNVSDSFCDFDIKYFKKNAEASAHKKLEHSSESINTNAKKKILAKAVKTGSDSPMVRRKTANATRGGDK